MIEKRFYVYDCDLDFSESHDDREDAESGAASLAEGNGYGYGVYLRVPLAGTDLCELRAVSLYDSGGKQIFETHAYDAELQYV